jgi:hypothetical protein
MVIIRIQPALNLEKRNDADLGQYVTDRAADLVANTLKFPGLKPTPDDLIDKNEDFSAALSSRAANRTTVKNIVRRELEIMLLTCADNCAEISNNDLSIYELSGFGYKRKPEPSGKLPAPTNLTVEIGPDEGQLYVRFKGVTNAHGYEIWFGKSGTDPETWTEMMGVSSGRKTLLNDLESNVSYGVRVRAIGAKKTSGEWTSVVIKKTY